MDQRTDTPTDKMEGIETSEINFTEETPSPCNALFKNGNCSSPQLGEESQENTQEKQEKAETKEIGVKGQPLYDMKVIVETVVEPPTPSLHRVASQDALYYESISEELTETKQKLQHNNSKLYLLTLENASYKEMVVRLERHADELQNDLDEKISNEKEMDATIKGLEAKLLETKRRHSIDLRNLMKNVRTEIEALQKSKEDLKTENDHLDTRITQLSNAEDDKSELIRSLTVKSQALETKMKVLESEIASEGEDTGSQSSERNPQKAELPTKNSDSESGICQLL